MKVFDIRTGNILESYNPSVIASWGNNQERFRQTTDKDFEKLEPKKDSGYLVHPLENQELESQKIEDNYIMVEQETISPPLSYEEPEGGEVDAPKPRRTRNSTIR